MLLVYKFATNLLGVLAERRYRAGCRGAIADTPDQFGSFAIRNDLLCFQRGMIQDITAVIEVAIGDAAGFHFLRDFDPRKLARKRLNFLGQCGTIFEPQYVRRKTWIVCKFGSIKDLPT